MPSTPATKPQRGRNRPKTFIALQPPAPPGFFLCALVDARYRFQQCCLATSFLRLID
jgi:hypothetical protein